MGDISDDEDESVERKLARLRREVEELKDELATRENEDESGQKSGGEQEKLGDGVVELSRAVDNLHVLRSGPGSYSAAAMLAQKLAADSPADSSGGNVVAAQKPSAEADKSTPAPAGLLSHAAAFEGRLALIEAAMGISSSSNPFIPDGSSGPALQPVLPALDHLTSRLSSLTNILVGPTPNSAVPTTAPASPTSIMTTPHLETLAARVRKLTADTEALASARKRAIDNAKAAQAARIASAAIDRAPDTTEVADPAASTSAEGGGGGGGDPTATQRDEQVSKINALYATLPTIQSLHPLLPTVLERLRSLRAIHAGAGQAAESLDELEKRQADMKREIEQWREGLKVVEEKMGQGEDVMKRNVEMVEPWVRDLEKRLDGLGR